MVSSFWKNVLQGSSYDFCPPCRSNVFLSPSVRSMTRGNADPRAHPLLNFVKFSITKPTCCSLTERHLVPLSTHSEGAARLDARAWRMDISPAEQQQQQQQSFGKAYADCYGRTGEQTCLISLAGTWPSLSLQPRLTTRRVQGFH
jgi:hypothetical protein